MATDIETGQEVVLDSGSLAQAMRASMSVPGAMSPVEIDGRLLVDGAIADNLPIDQARKLCADVIIAVNISTPPLTRSEITSAFSVVTQLLNFLGKQTVDDQLKSLTDKDVLIAPDLGDISAVKFDRSKDAIRIGEEATRALADKLRRYSLPPEQYAAVRARQVAEAKALGTVDEIRVEGLAKTNPAVVRELVESKPGEPLSEEKIGADLRRIFGTRDYESIDYRIVGGDLGPRAMVIAAEGEGVGVRLPALRPRPRQRFPGRQPVQCPRPVPEDLAQPAGRRMDDRGADRPEHARVHRVLPAAQRGGPLVHRAQRADRTADARRVRRTGQGRQLPDQFGRGRRRRRHESGNLGPAACRCRLVEGLREGRHGLARPALRAGDDRGAPRGAVRRPDQHRLVPVRRLRIRRDGLRRNDVVRIGAEAISASKGLRAASAAGEPNVFNVAVSGGTALGSDMPAYESFTLGGPLRLSGYRINEFSGREYAFGRLMYYHRIYSLPDILGSGLYFGGSGGSRLHRQSLRQLAVAGNAMVRIGVPRRGYVPRAGVPGSRLRRSRQLEPLPAARRAVGRLQGRNQALPTTKYSAVVPGLAATSMPASMPNLLANL